VWGPYYGRAFFLKKRLPINFHSLIPEHLSGLAPRRHAIFSLVLWSGAFPSPKIQLPLSTLDANIVLNLAIIMPMGNIQMADKLPVIIDNRIDRENENNDYLSAFPPVRKAISKRLILLKINLKAKIYAKIGNNGPK